MEVEHCHVMVSFNFSRVETAVLTLKREKDVETGAPARRVAQEVDELSHERTGELDRVLKASTGDQDSSSGASELLRDKRRVSGVPRAEPQKLTSLSSTSCMRKNSGSSLVMKGKAVLTRKSDTLVQIQVRTV